MARSPKISEDRASSRKVSALGGLAPFLRPYRAMLALALAALTLTAGISLILPLAVRRVVDGFGTTHLELLDQYFLAFLGIAAALALGTGLRYYVVTRLGERVVADIRRAVFDRVTGFSPAFFERIMTGEVVSRLTTDTTLILSVIGSSVSVTLKIGATWACCRAGRRNMTSAWLGVRRAAQSADAAGGDGHAAADLAQADRACAVDRAGGDHPDHHHGPPVARAVA